jgi:hypothetical protein
MKSKSMNKVSITKLELEALRAIDNSEYGDSLGSDIWDWSVAQNIVEGTSPKSVPGILSSLSKKGLVICNGEGKEATVGMTDMGQLVYIASVGLNKVNKRIDEEILAIAKNK